MTAPLFSVNEEVIVIDDVTGERFEAVITSLMFDGVSGRDPRNGDLVPPGWFYWTNRDFHGMKHDEFVWAEISLRKKPRPSSQSFDEIIEEIKQKQSIPA